MKIHSPHPSLAKVPTGIQGFDEVTDGGLPARRTTLVIGGPGCGKTIFALQALVNGAQREKEAGMYMSGDTEQSAARQAGIDRGIPFIEKPFTAADLARRVRDALDRLA